MMTVKGKCEEIKNPIRFSKKVVFAVLISVLAFTITMIVVFLRMAAVPDTLVTAFFAFAGGEAGVLGLIRIGESKYDKPQTMPGEIATGAGEDSSGDAVG